MIIKDDKILKTLQLFNFLFLLDNTLISAVLKAFEICFMQFPGLL